MKPLYFAMRKNRKKWRTTLEDMQQMPEGSLGSDIAAFLQQHNLELMADVAWHDVYHVVFGYDTSIRDEGCIQFVPLGNGKWSAPYITCNLFFAAFYPEYWADFYKAYRRGKAANKFYDWDFEPLLTLPTVTIRCMIFGEEPGR